jgi:hypothetical protein
LFGGGSPDAGIGADTFSGVFEGYFQPDSTEAYTFRTASDDGISLRIWDPVTGASLLDFNNINTFRGISAAGTFQDVAGTLSLTAGTKYPMQVRFNEGGGDAAYRVGFSTPTLPAQVIPTAQLFRSWAPRRSRPRPTPCPHPDRPGERRLPVRGPVAGRDRLRGRARPQRDRPFTTITLSPDSTTFIEDPAGLTNGSTVYYRVRTTGPAARRPSARSSPSPSTSTAPP